MKQKKLAENNDLRDGVNLKREKRPLPAGIEPATFRLTAERSTYWAIGAIDKLTLSAPF